MRPSLLRITVLLAVLMSVGAKKPRDINEHAKEHRKMMMEKQQAWREQQDHLNKIHADEVDDWSLHTDVDDSKYWFSHTLRRSQREPPKGWTKDAKGNWKAPPRKRDEL